MPLLLNSLTFLLLLYSLYKLRNAHLLLFDMRDQARSDNASLFRQLEALQGLYAELDLKSSLPPTRDWAASPDFLLEVARHARSARPACVVECSSGVSTLVLARCMQLNGAGSVISLEHDPHYAEKTRLQLRLHGLQDWAQVLDAPLRPHTLSGESWPWYTIAALPAELSIDLLVIDGPPQATRAQARYPAGPLLFPRLAPEARIFLDDAARSDELAIVQRWQQEFPALQLSSRVCEKGCAVLLNAS
ncbi:class I SAM-dependent methyltransferase [Pseudoduganella sp. FT25W]|uniref:Class I SAM-dependent methyltransferase n=1 Tax=Duganella alba TaxID=2666081 RepID=A0A6L5Q9G3_9BURK|nr:class I SAM-dependent methyltransferase [Duganella alba]MRX06444.1 class I SAM-dependent methyltransferase [Duganella alba]MRX14838.1 class I SAM-dependent methyltransferase [Duganella alba]